MAGSDVRRSYAHVHVAAAILTGLHAALLVHVNRHVQEPYMDEIFHVPQTKQYCLGHWSTWDPKITTFPGLYLASVLMAWAARGALIGAESLGILIQHSLGRSTDWEDALCSARTLRWANVGMLVALFYVVYFILEEVSRGKARVSGSSLPNCHGGQGRPKAVPGSQSGLKSKAAVLADPRASQGPDASLVLLYALTICAFPLIWFYTFLYYTDMGSLLMLLVCHFLSLRYRFFPATLAGAAAVLFRQTNAVWVTFLIGSSTLRLLEGFEDQKADRSPIEETNYDRLTGQDHGIMSLSPPSLFGTVASEVRWTLMALHRHWRRVLARLWPMLAIPTGFAAFLAANGGAVVVGDREAHAPVMHWAQLLYFGGFAAASLAPVIFLTLTMERHTLTVQLGRKVGGEVGEVGRSQALASGAAVFASFMALTAVCAALARQYSLAHPYLLADNRHYTFYIWRRLIGRPNAWLILSPVYAISWMALCAALYRGCKTSDHRRSGAVWVAGFLFTLTVTLVPAHLLELRYFSSGVILVALHLGVPLPKSNGARRRTLLLLLMLGASYCIINAATLYVFTHRPFSWPDGTVARFMW